MWSMSAEQARVLAEFLQGLGDLLREHPSIDVDFSYGGVQIEGRGIGSLRQDGDEIVLEESP